MSHVHYRNEAEANWADADDSTALDAALYYSQMATYGATADLVEEVQLLREALHDLRASRIGAS